MRRLQPSSPHLRNFRWKYNLGRGAARTARETKRLVFIDFTGVACLSCRKNEAGVFTNKEVLTLLQDYTLLQLYTDMLPKKLYPPDQWKEIEGDFERRGKDAEPNQSLEADRFGTKELPLYVILQPMEGNEFKVVDRKLGLVEEKDYAKFRSFLSDPLKAARDVRPPDKALNVEIKDLISFTATVSPGKAKPGQTVRLTITGTPKAGYHTYPLTKRTPDQKPEGISRIQYVANPPVLKPIWPATETEPVFVDEGKDLGVLLEHKEIFSWSQDVLILPDAVPGNATLRGKIDLQVCNEQKCFPGTLWVEATVDVSPGDRQPLADDVRKRLETKPEVIVVEPPEGFKKATSSSDLGGLFAFILQGIFWGAISLVTPCVFPMIPITVSFFLKQSEHKEHRALTMAAVYSLTIVVVLTIAAAALLSFFRWLSVNPIMNIGLGGLFIVFALSLFGMYEIQLPSGLANFTSSREGRGGLLGTMFMALTFTIISFACVAPFLGGFGGTAATGELPWSHRILGGFAFSVTFASPFFVLALFPGLIKKMPKSGNWLNSVKVVMGFLELAAALKFFRAGELVLVPTPVFFTYDFVLGLYVAICVLCGLYLLNLFRLPHDTVSENLGVVQMLFSMFFLGLAVYLVPALFKIPDADGSKQRPSGVVFAWLDSFLLPDEATDLPWGGNLEKGLKEAAEKDRLVFVDFTGKTCTNCKINERDVFSKREFKELFKQYTLVQLYTDIVPDKLYSDKEREQFKGGVEQQRADAARNLAFQKEKFNTEQLPYYVILKPLPDGTYKEIAHYDEGKINHEAAFMQFLRNPLRKKG